MGEVNGTVSCQDSMSWLGGEGLLGKGVRIIYDNCVQEPNDGSGYRGGAQNRGGSLSSWWMDGREGGWQGDGKERKRSLKGYREWRKEAAGSRKGSSEKETIRNKNGPISR